MTLLYFQYKEIIVFSAKFCCLCIKLFKVLLNLIHINKSKFCNQSDIILFYHKTILFFHIINKNTNNKTKYQCIKSKDNNPKRGIIFNFSR
jgi:hypothetical protein